MNYFNLKTSAERYSRGRPDFHHNTINRIKAYLQLENKLDNALDIACGTGLSTKALLEIATSVYGTDLSLEMLNSAHQKDKINYSIAPAEKQPFPDNYFDLITVCSGVHWFDIDEFLKEANRLLKNKAWLVLYENHFIAEMPAKDSFSNWFSQVYLRKYPSPPRNNNYIWTNETLNSRNFMLAKEEIFKNPIVFNKLQLILYFTTQSNIIAAVDKGQTTYERAEAWLNKELETYFAHEDDIQTIHFGNWIKYLQRAN